MINAFTEFVFLNFIGVFQAMDRHNRGQVTMNFQQVRGHVSVLLQINMN